MLGWMMEEVLERVGWERENKTPGLGCVTCCLDAMLAHWKSTHGLWWLLGSEMINLDDLLTHTLITLDYLALFALLISTTSD